MKARYPVPVAEMPVVPSTTTRLLIDAVWPFRWRASGFLALTLLGVVSWAAAPFMVSKIVTDLSIHHRVSGFIWLLVALYLFFRLMDEIMWRLGELLLRSCKPQMVESVRMRLFAAILRRPYSFFVNASSGRIGYFVNTITMTANTIIDTTAWTTWGQVASLVISAFFLLATHWTLAVLFAVWLIALFSYNMYRGKEFARLVALESDEESKAAGMVVDALSNHVSVRAFQGQALERRMLADQQQTIITRWRKSWIQNIVTNLVKGQSVAYITSLALVLVIALYANGTISLGAIVLFVAYFGDASTGLWQLAWALDTYYRDFGTIQNALDNVRGEDERTADLALPEWPKGDVRLELHNLSFAYPEQPDVPVLDCFSLGVAANERVGIVGHSGAGKSTLVGLLLGFFEPQSGNILLNGMDTREYGPQLIRANSSYVPQDTNLFNRTIRENVAYAKPDATDEEIMSALEKAQALGFVQKLPEGLDSTIGERGVKLSGGQRQRIAIARALLQGAPLLVLDEATSALDSMSEQAIQKALFELMQNRTAIVIAHRLSTLKNLDRIIVLEDGKIAEQGTHAQLVRKGGIYADLWKRQKNGFVAE